MSGLHERLLGRGGRRASAPSGAAAGGAAPSSSYPPLDDASHLARLGARLGAGPPSARPRAPPPPALHRARDKTVDLLQGDEGADGDGGAAGEGDALLGGAEAGGWDYEASAAPGGAPWPPPDPEGPGSRRITIHCTAEAYDLEALQAHLVSGGYRCELWPGGVLHSRYVRRTGEAGGDIYFFGFGAVVFWDLQRAQEGRLLGEVGRFAERPLARAFAESEVFRLRHAAPGAKPQIANDVVSLAPGQRDAGLVRVAISFALAQSTKLAVLEDRVARVAAVTGGLPRALAAEGRVAIPDRDVARLQGRVFLEQRELGLLGHVLDRPAFFWGAPDAVGRIYDRCCDYLDMEDRTAVLNTRLGVLHGMLEMLRAQAQALHGDQLTNFIIALIGVDLLILLFQLAALAGWLGSGFRGGALALLSPVAWAGGGDGG